MSVHLSEHAGVRFSIVKRCVNFFFWSKASRKENNPQSGINNTAPLQQRLCLIACLSHFSTYFSFSVTRSWGIQPWKTLDRIWFLFHLFSLSLLIWFWFVCYYNNREFQKNNRAPISWDYIYPLIIIIRFVLKLSTDSAILSHLSWNSFECQLSRSTTTTFKRNKTNYV
jgi:hypothetical protein